MAKEKNLLQRAGDAQATLDKMREANAARLGALRDKCNEQENAFLDGLPEDVRQIVLDATRDE